MTGDEATRCGAVLSECRRYRYELWRRWSDLAQDRQGYVAFIGLNPSTADETTDDRTIGRCVGFARSWGFSALCMLNLFAWRATDPRDMLRAANPVGPDNDRHLVNCAQGASLLVAAWGARGSYLGRDQQVCRLLPGLQVLRLTKGGHPEHPLYLPGSLRPIAWAHT